MAALPQEYIQSQTVRAIYAAYEKANVEGPRRYLGASVIGRECDRAIWYDFHWCGREVFSGRMLRLFETGSREESRFVANLRAIGCEVHDVDESGNQFATSALAGHVRGHMDGVALGVPEAPKTRHLLEFKTHSHKSFRQLVLHGVREAKPEHFAQMQIYMHLGGLSRALYLAVDKDTDELYSERINYELHEATRLLGRAKSIIEAEQPPERISANPADFRCKFCHHAKLCHGRDPEAHVVPAGVNCRTCCHSTPVMTGDGWTCERGIDGGKLSDSRQAVGCEHHLFNPGLLLDRATDAGDGWIEYADTFRNGFPPNGISSFDLSTKTRSALSLPVIS